MIQRALVRNLLSAAGQTLVQSVTLFLLYRYFIRQLGIEQFGVWSVVLATASAARISELGLSSSVTKFVATYRAQGDDLAAGETLQTAAIALASVLAVFLIGLFPVFLVVLRYVLPPQSIDAAVAILPFALASMWLSAMSGLWLGALDGCLRTDLRAALVMVCTVLFAGMAWLGVRGYGLFGLAVAHVGQGVLLLLLGWAAVRLVIRDLPLVPTQWRRSRFVEIFSYGANMQVMMAVTMLLEPTTKVLFARYGGLSAAGYFELTQQLVLKMRALIVESNRVVVPVIAGMAEHGGAARQLYATNVKYLVFFTTPLFACVASLAPAISEMWLGYYEIDFVIMTVVLALTWYLNSLSAPAYFFYLGHGRLRWLTVSHVGMGVSNVALGPTLGYLFGWPGVLAAFSLSLLFGSYIAVASYHREQQTGLRDVLSGQDLLLVIACGGLACASAWGYDLMLRNAFPLWARLTLTMASLAGMAAIVWRHPLAAQLVPALGRKAARGRRGGGML